MNKNILTTWLVSYLSQLVGISEEMIDTSKELERYGLDSTAGAGLIGDLNEWLSIELDITTIYDYPSIDLLSDILVEHFAVEA